MDSKPKYDVDYFIDKFEAIPEKNWTVGVFQETHQPTILFGAVKYGEPYKRCCAQGFCTPEEYRVQNEDKKYWNHFIWHRDLIPDNEASCLYHLFNKRLAYNGLADVNNGYSLIYNQKTPKQRVLAALYDIKNNVY